jgi:hypothetical protein
MNAFFWIVLGMFCGVGVALALVSSPALSELDQAEADDDQWRAVSKRAPLESDAVRSAGMQ